MRLYAIRTRNGNHTLWLQYQDSENSSEFIPNLDADCLTVDREEALAARNLITWLPTELVAFDITEVKE